ncbi:MAG: hypothetical protein ACKVQR_04435 [Aquabacterium sp.]
MDETQPWPPFQHRDRVRHVNLGDGTVTLADDRLVHVTYDDAKSWGSYDRTWFSIYPRNLVASSTEAAPAPPEYMIAAAEEAMAEDFVRWGMNIAPGAIRTLAVSAIKAARTSALNRRVGAPHA